MSAGSFTSVSNFFPMRATSVGSNQSLKTVIRAKKSKQVEATKLTSPLFYLSLSFLVVVHNVSGLEENKHVTGGFVETEVGLHFLTLTDMGWESPISLDRLSEQATSLNKLLPQLHLISHVSFALIFPDFYSQSYREWPPPVSSPYGPQWQLGWNEGRRQVDQKKGENK